MRCIYDRGTRCGGGEHRDDDDVISFRIVRSDDDDWPTNVDARGATDAAADDACWTVDARVRGGDAERGRVVGFVGKEGWRWEVREHEASRVVG